MLYRHAIQLQKSLLCQQDFYTIINIANQPRNYVGAPIQLIFMNKQQGKFTYPYFPMLSSFINLSFTQDIFIHKLIIMYLDTSISVHIPNFSKFSASDSRLSTQQMCRSSFQGNIRVCFFMLDQACELGCQARHHLTFFF